MVIWIPDTCACILEYNGVDIPSNFSRPIKRCTLHVGLLGSALESAVRTRNITQNSLVVGQIQDERDRLKKLAKDATEPAVDFKS